MKGYWQNEQETAIALRVDPQDPDPRPWLYTGDIAVMDEHGYFRIVDRKKDIIISSGGYKVYPREVEEVLYQHPRVLEAAAAGCLVPERGERVKAFVVLKPGEQVTAEELIAFCRERLAPYKVPRWVEFRESIPKTTLGKPLRRQLRQESAAAEQKEPTVDEPELIPA